MRVEFPALPFGRQRFLMLAMTHRILVADDHDLFLKGLRDAIKEEKGFELVAQSTDGIDAIAQIAKHKPDCVVTDFAMPGANGLQVLSEGRNWSPTSRFVLITGFSKPAQVKEFVEAGFHGVFLKTTSVKDIMSGIAAVMAGETVLAPEISEFRDSSPLSYDLTNREIETLKAIAQGMSNNQVAEKLGISPKTVDSHRTNLMRKMEVNSTAALLMRAFKDGWLGE